MNERIKELLKEATIASLHSTTDMNEQDFLDKYGAIQLEKFAELIVRECANVILEWKSEPFPYDPEFGAKIICKHFGVE